GGRLRRAYERAGQTGEVLARIVAELAQASGRPVSVIGHSLGGRVALSCLATAELGSLSRMVLLNAAEFRDMAEHAVNSPAGARAEILNVISRENDLFDVALERLIGGGRRRAIGLGLPQPRSNWIDLQIDESRSLRALAGLGYPVSVRRRLLSHWSPCQTPGLFNLYRTILCAPGALPWQVLRQNLPDRPEPRWSRLVNWGRDAAPAIPSHGLAQTA
ncbi:MAG: alpha/beta fold hydrolase, partial [Paracoccus sp. (in: a-proteobacteria)]|nr:alpha/beta fold hydrolase [Paracoccus sp. (in: a-proteobacteria)]